MRTGWGQDNQSTKVLTEPYTGKNDYPKVLADGLTLG